MRRPVPALRRHPAHHARRGARHVRRRTTTSRRASRSWPRSRTRSSPVAKPSRSHRSPTTLDAARGDADRGLALLARRAALRLRADGAVRDPRHRPTPRRLERDRSSTRSPRCPRSATSSCCAASGTRDLRKPPGYFLVGPTGVGKNHLVESLGRVLESASGSVEIPTLTIEGPNYTYPSDINELRGATRGFIRSDEEGLLAAFQERASKAPVSIILVDEVEKAHPQLRTFFLSILDRGTTTDNKGRVLNLANAIVFFTSNLGYSDLQQRAAPIGYGDDATRWAGADADVRSDLRRALSPEFMNRVRHDPLRPADPGERRADPGSRIRADRPALPRGARSRRSCSIPSRAASCSPAASPRRSAPGAWPPRSRASATSRSRSASAGTIAAAPKTAMRSSRGCGSSRQGARPFDPNEVRREVLGAGACAARLRASCGSRFRDGAFVYEPEGSRA